MFDWDRFKNGEIAVHCDTEEKANDFLKECGRKDIIWIGGDKATHHNYSVNYEETCYFCRSKKITYCDRKHFNKKGIEIIKWEIKSMKELTFKEVIANIKEGEVWESNKMSLVVKMIEGKFYIGDRYDNGVDGFIGQYIPLTLKFTLERKKYTFEEAFKAYEEGKEIESCESEFKYKYINKKDMIWGNMSISWSNNYDGFGMHEIRGKWYIND